MTSLRPGDSDRPGLVGSVRLELGGQAEQVDLVPGRGDLAVFDPDDRGRGELHLASGRRDADEIPGLGAGPLLMRGNQIALGDQDQDLVVEIRKGVKESIDRLLLASSAL